LSLEVLATNVASFSFVETKDKVILNKKTMQNTCCFTEHSEETKASRFVVLSSFHRRKSTLEGLPPTGLIKKEIADFSLTVK